jgi:hypothetical protein
MSQDFLRVRFGEDEKLKVAMKANDTIWVLGVEFFEGRMITHEFRRTHYKELINFLKDIQRGKLTASCYGIWRGEWRTDLFEIDPGRFLKE